MRTQTKPRLILSSVRVGDSHPSRHQGTDSSPIPQADKVRKYNQSPANSAIAPSSTIMYPPPPPPPGYPLPLPLSTLSIIPIPLSLSLTSPPPTTPPNIHHYPFHYPTPLTIHYPLPLSSPLSLPLPTPPSTIPYPTLSPTPPSIP